MKFSLKNIFLLFGITHILGATIVLMAPSVLSIGTVDVNPVFSVYLKMYLVSILILGIVSYLCYQYFSNTNPLFRKILLVILSFHLIAGFQWYSVLSLDDSLDKTLLYAHFTFLLIGSAAIISTKSESVK